jgi:hypothetical protein
MLRILNYKVFISNILIIDQHPELISDHTHNYEKHKKGTDIVIERRSLGLRLY